MASAPRFAIKNCIFLFYEFLESNTEPNTKQALDKYVLESE